ncbi:hypothetical protein NP233_g8714 [Leucocoprinus birnbaumii]|uniref:Uncharacterized protein n=1 Tax=Leucocoprinus birnbaumii TaxID=56174 RepID=A0AAD5VP86_9AGAR|nr:hypothetical protein NP233_g8714 [Leucocoprinus birnbaumii]
MSFIVTPSPSGVPTVHTSVEEEIRGSATRAQLIRLGNEAYLDALEALKGAEQDRDYALWEKNDYKDDARCDMVDAQHELQVVQNELAVLQHKKDKLQAAYKHLVERLIAELVAIKPSDVAAAIGQGAPASDDDEKEVADMLHDRLMSLPEKF